MAASPRYPSLFQINTRVWLERLSREAGKRVTLADIDDATIDRFAEQGFDWIWLLSVWQIGTAGRAVSRSHPEWRAEFQAALPDLTEEDICGSGFAITAYTVSDALGGETGLARFREKLARRGIKLMLDFVPNHTALDHPWVEDRPRIFCRGQRRGFGRQRRKITCGSRPIGDRNLGVWPRSQFSRLAGHAAAQLRQSGNCMRPGSTNSSQSPANATACAATWRCCYCPTSSSGPGD